MPATSPIALGSKRRLVRIRPSRLYLQVAGLCRLDSWLSRSLDRQLTVKLNVNRRQWLSRISLMGRAVNVPVVSPLNGSLLRLLKYESCHPSGLVGSIWHQVRALILFRAPQRRCSTLTTENGTVYVVDHPATSVTLGDLWRRIFSAKWRPQLPRSRNPGGRICVSGQNQQRNGQWR